VSCRRPRGILDTVFDVAVQSARTIENGAARTEFDYPRAEAMLHPNGTVRLIDRVFSYISHLTGVQPRRSERSFVK